MLTVHMDTHSRLGKFNLMTAAVLYVLTGISMAEPF
jgi:hypothetical protein